MKISTLLQLELGDLPPSVNQMYRTGRNGNRYKRAEVSEWQDSVSRIMREARNNQPPYMGEVEVHVIFRVANNRKWDVDNRLKALFDCLEKGRVIKDDSQIWGVVACRVKGENSGTIIKVKKYTGKIKKS